MDIMVSDSQLEFCAASEWKGQSGSCGLHDTYNFYDFFCNMNYFRFTESVILAVLPQG